MNSQQQPNNLDLENEGNLRKILRTITLSDGAFSLVLLHCNYTFFQEQIFTKLSSKLQEGETVKTVKKIDLLPNIKTIYTNIADQLNDQPLAALMIFGLGSLQNIDEVLKATNRAREEFRNQFNFPVFLWVNDVTINKIIRLAPDFKSWATTIEFKPSSHQLFNFLQQQTDIIFNGDITNLLFTNLCQELASAKQDLQQRGEILNPEINASLEYIFGYRDYLDDHLDSALEHYQQSLAFWQASNNLDRQSTTLVNIGLLYYRQALINQLNNQNSWQQARNYFQQSLEIFQQTANQDLLSQYITLLCEVYLKLESWQELETLVNESLNIHQQEHNYRLFLAKDNGFLAEIALHKSNFQEARNYAETALQILSNLQRENIVHIPKNEQVYYQFLLAKSYHGLNDLANIIQILETAKNNTEIQYNPHLYTAILDKLNQVYRQQGEYLTAFNTKQEKLQIEQQYGFRAFVGASYLNPQRKIIKSVNSEVTNTGTIAQEISASGREDDIIKLKTRIAEDKNKLIVIHGQSGVGKSSILQAGLIPALQQETIAAKKVLPLFLRVYTNWLGELKQGLNVVTIPELPLHSAIIQQLRNNSNNNLLTVLIFDQFEEFFFVYQQQTTRQEFYDFLRECLDIPDVKVVLSLREDYLHYLLEIERKFANLKLTDIVNSIDIIGKYNRYYLGNFSPTSAKQVFTSLSQRSKYPLEEKLIDKLVEELAGNIDEIRPIELQIVGTQLENLHITTLEEYQEVGNKEKLVAGFLENVINDCGTDNDKEIANLVLYLLTDENKTRPLKTYSELAEELKILDKNIDNLADVIKILVASGLVVLIPESPENRYQLVHDYLVEFIRKQYKDDLLENYAKTKAELEIERQNKLLAEEKFQKEQEANEILANAKSQADKQNIEAQKRLKLSSALAIGLLIISGIASVYGMNQFSETQKAKKEQEELQAKTQELQNKTQNLALKSQQAENNKKAADFQLQKAREESKKAQENLLAAKADLEQVNKQAATLKQKNQEANLKIQQANVNVKIAEEKSRQAAAKQQQAISQAKKAEEIRQKAQAALTQANQATKKAKKEQEEALQGTNLERAGVNSLRQFQYEALPSLMSAIKNGKELKNIVKNRPLEKYPAFSPIYTLNTILDNIKERNQFKGHQGYVNSVSFSPDGKTIATASSDNTARLWNLQGQMLQEFKGHQGSVRSVSFSPDGKTIATASSDNTARLWNLQGQMLQEFKGHQ
ncbi:MAG: eIF2A-related protein, partial [Cuspidothrix sp.]